MAKFLFTCWPWVGHVYPQISIASALRARGHSVAFYTGERARGVLEAEGLTLFPFRQLVVEPIWDEIVAKEATSSSGWFTPGLYAKVFRDWLTGTIPNQVSDLQAILRDWQPDVIVTDMSMWAPIFVLWETSGIPVAISSTFIGCLLPGPDAPPWGAGLPPPRTPATRLLSRVASTLNEVVARPLRQQLGRVRAAYTLPPLDCSVSGFTGRLPLYLMPSLPELDYQRSDLPPCVHYVGSCVWNEPTTAPDPDWLSEVPTDRPWVHVTEGTLHRQHPFLLRAAVEGLASEPLEVILTTGPQRDPDEVDLGKRGPNIRVAQWISHNHLLPHCEVVVTTGGPATIMAALTAGVPLVIVPTHWDKADNARRVVQAGCGVSLASRRCTPHRLRAAVQQVMTEPRFRANTQRLQRLLADAPGPTGAAKLLESLLPAPALAQLATEVPV